MGYAGGWGSADEEGTWRLGDLERRRGVAGRNDNSVNEAEGKKMWHLCSLSPEKVEISHKPLHSFLHWAEAAVGPGRGGR